MSGATIAIAIITALDRELHPLVDAGGWTRTRLDSGGRSLVCYEAADRVAVAGGIGRKHAEAAARALVEKYHPQMLISAGLAGALIPSLKVASIVPPNVIVDAATGTEYRCNRTSTTETRRHEQSRVHQQDCEATANSTNNNECGAQPPSAAFLRPREASRKGQALDNSTADAEVVLVTASEIAGAPSKANLAERYHAQVVDMEAAGVARVAQECKTGFRCVKAISDEFDFPMPPLNRFVDSHGNFKTGSFGAWAALRPHYWLRVVQLSRNSGQAVRALSAWLEGNLGNKGGENGYGHGTQPEVMGCDDRLRQELLAMEGEDRRVRADLEAAGELGKGYHPRMEAVHRSNSRRLREIIAAHGWPGRAMVGEDGAKAAWFILQHSIGEPEFMRASVGLLERSVAGGEAPPWHLAYLTDRIALYEGRPQRYGSQWDVEEDGTQVLWELELPKQVDELRKSVGLEPLTPHFPGARWQEILSRKSSEKRLREFAEWARSTGWRK
jgi:nucleoside phosphorylase